MTDPDPQLCDGDPLARQLAALAPAPPALTRDQLMFAAGAASRDRDVRFWKRLTAAQPAVLASIAVGLALLPGSQPSSVADRTPTAEPPKVYHAQPPAVPPYREPSPLADAGDPASRSKYIQLRADVFAVGLNVLPSPVTPPPAADPDKLEKDLHLPRGLFAVPGRPMPPPDPTAPDE